MRHDQRVFFDGVDLTVSVNDFREGEALFHYTTGKYLYIASVLPFNNLYFGLGTLNDVTSLVAVEIWNNGAWIPAVDVIDQTSGLKLDGRISWNTNPLKGWTKQAESADVTGLVGATVYNHYWIRLAWSVSLKATTSIKFIGQKFSEDLTLFSEYPDLNNAQMMRSFKSGKTDWNEQHYMAAERIIDDLMLRNLVKSKSQILDWSIFNEASHHRVASLVYLGMGRPYFDQLLEARKQYAAAMNKQFYNLDLNANASLETFERNASSSFLRR